MSLHLSTRPSISLRAETSQIERVPQVVLSMLESSIASISDFQVEKSNSDYAGNYTRSAYDLILQLMGDTSVAASGE